MNRRDFLMSSVAWAGENKSDSVLVVVFLRGGCDALNLVVPASGEDRKIYEDERPNIRIPAASLLPLDTRFGLHPSAKGLHDLYTKKQLAVVVASGVPSNNRSHFDAQAYMDLGTPDKKSTTSGWLARHIEGYGGAGPLRSITVGQLTPISLLGCDEATSLARPNQFNNLGGDKKVQEDMCDALARMYNGHYVLNHRTRSALATIRNFEQMATPPPSAIAYPGGEVGNRFKTLAQLINSTHGIQVATIDMGGWDTHKNQDGAFNRQVEQLSGSIDAFYKELAGKNVTTVIVSEFGRRLRENANRGTDHGHGGMMMVVGPKVHGGRVHGDWPGLKTEQLYERADLAVKTDYRQVLSEVLSKVRAEKNLAKIFPGFQAGSGSIC